MKTAQKVAVVVWMTTFVGLWSWAATSKASGQPSTLQPLYGKLQPAFFTGFLTLAGFILTLMTQILLRLHKELFDDPLYIQRVETASLLYGRPHNRYAPLINLGNFLVWTVLICLSASVVQITLGLVPEDWAVAGCFASVGAAMVFVFFSWQAIRENLRLWFELLRMKDEPKAEEKRP